MKTIQWKENFCCLLHSSFPLYRRRFNFSEPDGDSKKSINDFRFDENRWRILRNETRWSIPQSSLIFLKFCLRYRKRFRSESKQLSTESIEISKKENFVLWIRESASLVFDENNFRYPRAIVYQPIKIKLFAHVINNSTRGGENSLPIFRSKFQFKFSN